MQQGATRWNQAWIAYPNCSERTLWIYTSLAHTALLIFFQYRLLISVRYYLINLWAAHYVKIYTEVYIAMSKKILASLELMFQIIEICVQTDIEVINLISATNNILFNIYFLL